MLFMNVKMKIVQIQLFLVKKKSTQKSIILHAIIMIMMKITAGAIEIIRVPLLIT